MKIIVTVECETISEFHAHLSKLQEQVEAETKRTGIDPLTSEIPDDWDLDDENCYGSHSVGVSEL